MAHEDNHRTVYLADLVKKFNSAFIEISALSESIVNSPCPEEAIKKMQPVIDVSLSGALSLVTATVDPDESDRREKRADKAAQSTYEEIYDRIKNWAKSQSWWKQGN